MKSSNPDRPEGLNGWRWEDPRWREWTEDDPVKILSEALRRAVDIRDTSARQNPLEARPVLLVDVLNALAASLGTVASDLWDGTDLWDGADLRDGANLRDGTYLEERP